MGRIAIEDVGATEFIKFQLHTHDAPKDVQSSKLNINYSL